MEKLILKTPYEWCVEENVRILDLNDWPLDWYGSKEKHFFEFPNMPKSEFLEALSKCKVKSNSQPRKTDMYLEYRMYGLVPYNLSPIQQGIQFGHGVVEYGQIVKGLGKVETIYNKWANKDKTFIILNGGTTNDSEEYYGSLQKNRDLLLDNGVQLSEFREPDLNNALTAICFLVDERVFNRELYKDFEPETIPYSRKKLSKSQLLDLEVRNLENHTKWVEKIGGVKNAFLRDFLKQFKLA